MPFTNASTNHATTSFSTARTTSPYIHVNTINHHNTSAITSPNAISNSVQSNSVATLTTTTPTNSITTFLPIIFPKRPRTQPNHPNSPNPQTSLSQQNGHPSLCHSTPKLNFDIPTKAPSHSNPPDQPSSTLPPMTSTRPLHNLKISPSTTKNLTHKNILHHNHHHHSP